MTIKLHSHLTVLYFVFLAAFSALAQADGEHHHHAANNDIEIQDAWIRYLPGNGPMAAYFTVKNNGSNDIVLDHACSKADFGQVAIHQSMQHDGQNHMHAVDEQLPIPAQGQLQFSPGGYHLMLTERKSNLQPGDTVRVMLHFNENDVLEADFEVRNTLTAE